MTQDLLLPIYYLCTLFLPPLLLLSTLEKFQVHYIILIKIYCMEQNLDIFQFSTILNRHVHLSSLPNIRLSFSSHVTTTLSRSSSSDHAIDW